MEKRVSLYDVLSSNVNRMTPWQCYCKSVEIFLPYLNFIAKKALQNGLVCHHLCKQSLPIPAC